MAATSLVDLPTDVVALCIDRSSPSSYIDVRNAVRTCRAFRCAVPDMAALIADCRAAQARAVKAAARAAGRAMASSTTALTFGLCDGALLGHVEPPPVIGTLSRSARRVVWFELASLRQPPLLWSDADVVKPLIVEYASAQSDVDRILADLVGRSHDQDSSAVSFASDLIRMYGVRRGDGAQRWHVSSKVWDCDVTPSLLSYLVALAVDVCCPAAERMPYLTGLVESIRS